MLGHRGSPPPLRGGSLEERVFPTGCAAPARRRTSLHPWLQAAAPLGPMNWVREGFGGAKMDSCESNGTRRDSCRRGARGDSRTSGFSFVPAQALADKPPVAPFTHPLLKSSGTPPVAPDARPGSRCAPICADASRCISGEPLAGFGAGIGTPMKNRDLRQASGSAARAAVGAGVDAARNREGTKTRVLAGALKGNYHRAFS